MYLLVGLQTNMAVNAGGLFITNLSNGKCWIFIKIIPRFILQVWIDAKSAFVWVMAWYYTGTIA